MIKKTITYMGFDGVERTEDFFFNLTKAEVMKKQMSTQGGLGEKIQRIVASQDQPEIIRIFEELILDAYGVKSDDGKRFIKSKELSTAFSQTEAFSQLFMELAEDDKKAAEFVNGIIPADMSKQIAASAKK